MQVKDKSEIIQWFEDQEQPYYVIHDKSGRVAQNLRLSEMEEATERLTRDMGNLEKDTYGTMYTIYISEVPLKKGDKLKEFLCCSYKAPLAPAEERSNFVPREQYYYNHLQPVFTKLEEKITQLQDQILALKMEESEDEEEVAENTQSNFLGAIMQNPAIQQVLAGLVVNTVNNLTGAKQPMAMAGVPDDDQQITQAIEILKRHDDQLGGDLMKLADMAENNNGQFNFLISMLRK